MRRRALTVVRTLTSVAIAAVLVTALGGCAEGSRSESDGSEGARCGRVPNLESRRAGAVDVGREQHADGDVLVILRWSGSAQSDVLEQIGVGSEGRVAKLAESRLPQRPQSYSGPVATSWDTCLVVDDRGAEVLEYSALQYRLSSHTFEEIGAASRPFSYFVGDFGFDLTSYSRFTGTALATPSAPEGMTDAPYVWVAGSARWQTLAQAYPVLSSAGRITAACYSPDGSLLAAGAGGRLLVYDLETGRVANFAGPEHSVWTLCVSQDNSELCWTDTDYPSRLGDIYSESPEPGRPVEAGFGIVSLRTGKAEYWPLSEQQGLPSELPGWCGWAEQSHSRCAFSRDGRRLYFQTAHALLCFDRQVSRWGTVARGYLLGFAVMPSRSDEGG